MVFTLQDSEPLLYHDEPIYRDGQLVCSNAHGAYGHYLGAAMGMGYLESSQGIDPEWIKAGRYEIEVEGKRYPAQAHLKPPYDPAGERLKA